MERRPLGKEFVSTFSFWLSLCNIKKKNSLFCFFKQKTAYEMRISDWSSDVCSSDLATSRSSRSSTSLPRRSLQRSVLAAPKSVRSGRKRMHIIQIQGRIDVPDGTTPIPGIENQFRLPSGQIASVEWKGVR